MIDSSTATGITAAAREQAQVIAGVIGATAVIEAGASRPDLRKQPKGPKLTHG